MVPILATIHFESVPTIRFSSVITREEEIMHSTRLFFDEYAMRRLQSFLQALCLGKAPYHFVHRLAVAETRWMQVVDFLTPMQQTELDAIADGLPFFQYWRGKLKAHYVLDEVFNSGGSAFVLFALVGSHWTYIVRVSDQLDFIPELAWMEAAGSR
jgi:hypothetical protein